MFREFVRRRRVKKYQDNPILKKQLYDECDRSIKEFYKEQAAKDHHPEILPHYIEVQSTNEKESS